MTVFKARSILNECDLWNQYKTRQLIVVRLDFRRASALLHLVRQRLPDELRSQAAQTNPGPPGASRATQGRRRRWRHFESRQLQQRLQPVGGRRRRGRRRVAGQGGASHEVEREQHGPAAADQHHSTGEHRQCQRTVHRVHHRPESTRWPARRRKSGRLDAVGSDGCSGQHLLDHRRRDFIRRPRSLRSERPLQLSRQRRRPSDPAPQQRRDDDDNVCVDAFHCRSAPSPPPRCPPASADAAPAANIPARAAVPGHSDVVARSDAQKSWRRRRRHQRSDGFAPRRRGTFDRR